MSYSTHTIQLTNRIEELVRSCVRAENARKAIEMAAAQTGFADHMETTADRIYKYLEEKS